MSEFEQAMHAIADRQGWTSDTLLAVVAGFMDENATTGEALLSHMRDVANDENNG